MVEKWPFKRLKAIFDFLKISPNELLEYGPWCSRFFSFSLSLIPVLSYEFLVEQYCKSVTRQCAAIITKVPKAINYYYNYS